MQIDNDECQINNGGCSSQRQCVNTIGSFYCDICPEGYETDTNTTCKGIIFSLNL